MIRMVLKSKVGADGMLHLEVPIGAADANREVEITIVPAVLSPNSQSHKEWLEHLKRTSGTWQGPFERPEQGEFEKRDNLQ